jgi:hypothetical protein
MSYGVDIPDLFRKAATYADRTLRGEKPADMPVSVITLIEDLSCKLFEGLPATATGAL